MKGCSRTGFMYDLIECWTSTNGLGVVRCETGGCRAAELRVVADIVTVMLTVFVLSVSGS